MSSRRPPPPLAEDPVGYVTAVAKDLSGPPLGYAFILLVCVVWVGGSFLVESLEAAGLSPLLLTYVCNALFVVLLPVYYARRHVLGGTTPEMTDGRGDAARRVGRPSRTSRSSVRDASARGNDASSGEDEADDYGTALLDVHEAPGGNVGEFEGDAEGSNPREGFNAAEGDDVSSSASRVGAERLRPNSVRDGDRRNSVTFAGYTEAERFEHTARAAVGIAPLWFAAQLAFNYSLLYTSVTSNSILSTSSAVFTFFLSVYLVNERYSKERVVAIFVYVLGSVLVTLADSGRFFVGESENNFVEDASSEAIESQDSVVIESEDSVSKPNPAFGNFLCVLAAALYAGYTAAIRWALPDDPETSMLLFLGLLGLCNFVGVGLLVLVGYAVFGFFGDLTTNCTPSAFALVVAKGLVDNVLSDYLWARAVLLTSPTTASVGLSMQIPMAAIAEMVLGHATWLKNASSAGAMLVGCGLVVGGFLGVVYY
jgi:solute carrier family 35 protein F5